MSKVVLPKRSSYLFPPVCVVCLKPAETEYEFTHTKHYVLFRRVYRISVPFCKEHGRRRLMPRVALVLSFIMTLLSLLLALLLETFLVALGLLVLGLMGVYFFGGLVAPLGFSFKVKGDRMEFVFDNPKYAEMFKEANKMLNELKSKQ